MPAVQGEGVGDPPCCREWCPAGGRPQIPRRAARGPGPQGWEASPHPPRHGRCATHPPDPARSGTSAGGDCRRWGWSLGADVWLTGCPGCPGPHLPACPARWPRLVSPQPPHLPESSWSRRARWACGAGAGLGRPQLCLRHAGATLPRHKPRRKPHHACLPQHIWTPPQGQAVTLRVAWVHWPPCSLHRRDWCYLGWGGWAGAEILSKIRTGAWLGPAGI